MAGAEQHRIKDYLLGQLTQAEEERLELRLLTEPDFAEEYDIVVTEIADDYVAGKFAGKEIEQVEEYFFKSAERREKLKFALALKEYKSSLLAKRRRNKNIFKVCVTIAASVLLVGGGFYIWRMLSYNGSLNDGLAALQATFRNERPVEARLSDFAYAPLANQRGGPTKVDYVQRDRAANLLSKAATEHPNAATLHGLGKYYLAEHEFDKAIDQLKLALDLDPTNAKIHSDLGAALLEEGRSERSKSHQGKELEIFARSLKHLVKALELDSSLLEAYFNRALVSQYLMPSEQAAIAWRQYLQKDSSSPWADEARRNLELLEENTRRTSWNTDDALKDFLNARRDGDNHAAWDVLAQSYTSAGNEVTNKLLDSLFELEPSSPAIESGDALQDLTYVAKLEFEKNKDRYTSDVVNHYKQATPKKRLHLADARRQMKIGYQRFTQSRFVDAIKEYEVAKLAYEQAGDHAGQAFVDYRLAHCYILRNDLKKAEAALKNLSQSCKLHEYHQLAALSLYGLAHASASDNEFSRAIDFSEQALAKFEESGELNGILKCLAQLADLNQSLHRIERTFGYLGRGLALASGIRAEPMLRWGLLVEMAFIMSSMNLDEAALFYHKEALAVAIAMGRPLLISRSHGYVGTTYATLKMYLEALGEATKAFDLGKGVPEDGGNEIMANASLQLAHIYRQSGDCRQAITAYSDSIQRYDSQKNTYFSYSAHKGKLLCYLDASDDEAVREELRTVLDLSEAYRSKITNESERVSFFDLEQSVFDLAIKFEFVRMKDPVRAFQYSEISRARSLLDALQMKVAVQRKSYGPDLSLPITTGSMSLFELQEKMPAETQILQYAILDDRLIIWVVTKSGISHVEVSVGTEVLTQKVHAYLKVVNGPPTGETGDYLAQAEDLYRLLVAPAEAFLDKSKFLCLVPDNILHYLPYSSLVSPVTKKYLIEDYELGIAPNSSIFVNLSAAAKEKNAPRVERLLSVGNPTFDTTAFSALRNLPSASREAQAVAALYPRPGRVLLRNEAREARVKSEMASADVIHFAMHYVINEYSAMLSGFPLTPEDSATSDSEDSDGFLQSFEIYMMSLPRTRLVVLSGCQTGIEQQYSGEGALGAARPFLVSGVPTVVASLWPVDSDASANLMTNLHRHRMHERLSATKALKQAQMEMARGDDRRYRHPYYWAPFVAIGGHTEY